MKFDTKRTATVVAIKQSQVLIPATSRISESRGTAEQRVEAARLGAIAHCRVAHAPSAFYGFGYSDAYYKDFTGPKTSHWDADHLCYLAHLLEVPLVKKTRFVWGHEHFHAGKGVFEFGHSHRDVSIQELNEAIDARISELNVSKAKIWEWMTRSYGMTEAQFNALDFAEKMATFREASKGELALTVPLPDAASE